MNLPREAKKKNKVEELLDQSQMLAKQNLLTVVREGGYQVSSPDDAWGKLVGVQTKIALDAANGSKATTAAKFVAQATGMIMGEHNLEGRMDIDDFEELGGEAALEILQIVLEAQKDGEMDRESPTKNKLLVPLANNILVSGKNIYGHAGWKGWGA